jgi:hypothetical protein
MINNPLFNASNEKLQSNDSFVISLMVKNFRNCEINDKKHEIIKLIPK